MRVAILGSWREEDKSRWDLWKTQTEFQEACRRVGQEVVARGHSLIVGADSLHTADANAVHGAMDALSANGLEHESPRIVLIRPESDGPPHGFSELRASRPGVFVEHQVDAGSWPVVKLVQTQLADAVILIGGAEKTEQAGLAAAVGKKPLACIGSFGGAAAKLNRRFERSPTAWGYAPDQINRLGEMQEPFSEHVLNLGLKLAWIEGAPKLMIIHGRSLDREVLDQYLRSYVGRVVVLGHEFAPSVPIPDKLEHLASSVDGAIALITPDDFGGLAVAPGSPALRVEEARARENVWVEVGWFWGRRGRDKLLLLKKGEVSIPSDLGNVEHYEYASDPRERSGEIQEFIAKLRRASG